MAISFEMTVEVPEAGTLAYVGKRDITKEASSRRSVKHLEEVVSVLLAFSPSGKLAEHAWEDRLRFLLHGPLSRLKAGREEAVEGVDRELIFFELEQLLYQNQKFNPVQFLETTAKLLLKEMQEARDVERYMSSRPNND